MILVTILCLAALAALIWTGFLVAPPGGGFESAKACSEEPLFASKIWKEMDRPGHRASIADPIYRRQLFERYAPLLKQDLERLIPHRRGWRCWFWYSCFRIHYALLMSRRARRLVPWKQDDLRLLLSLILHAAQACTRSRH